MVEGDATPAGERLDSLVAECLERIDAEGDSALDAVCASNPDLAAEIRRRVGRLAAAGFARADGGSKDEARWIGPYRLLERLGEGGMGVVWLAEQRRPVRRRVAVKIIKKGMDSAGVLRRFEAERQALALMNHDNIARIHDAGTTGEGQPYFAMEHVAGLPITDYCDRHRLSVEERLGLFARVCNGVQHAHQRGVIHRDIKPTNVLVTTDEGTPEPKIIDFGLARAIDHSLVEGTLHTEAGQVVGTPEYMSPEQAEMSSQDIDTRTDVYSLGVLLYELLTGALPFDSRELRSGGMLEARRRIREDEPPRPSTRLTSLGESGTRVAQARRTEVRVLQARLRTDLDWIVMRALEKDRTRRYATASELAAEIGRFLRDEPVLAGPPTVGYRARKFCRRYRLQVGAASVVLVALVAGLMVSIAFYRRAERSAAEAQERANAEAREHARAEEMLRRFDLLAISERLDVLLREVPELPAARPENVETLAAWVDRARGAVATLPEIEASITALRDGEDRGTGAPTRTEDRFLHDALVRLADRIRGLAAPGTGALARLGRDLDHARVVEDRTVTQHANAWERARLAILRADDADASARYREVTIELRPQIGLVPIGANPVTGLWEFYHPRSGAPDRALPEHDTGGRIAVTEDLGLVFVLLPGGTRYLGAGTDPDRPNHDPNAQENEGPVHEVTVAPFFVSRFEMTRGQWCRLTGGSDPSQYEVGFSALEGGPTVGWTNPVERVSWVDCVELLRRDGLALPTRDQWEYACRAGTSTPWHVGDDPRQLAGYANLADRTAALVTAQWPPDEFLEDGFVIHAPVGSFAANAFGLHDTHGNVFEWCLGLEDDEAPKRGGAFLLRSNGARASATAWDLADTGQSHTGLRPVRALDR